MDKNNTSQLTFIRKFGIEDDNSIVETSTEPMTLLEGLSLVDVLWEELDISKAVDGQEVRENVMASSVHCLILVASILTLGALNTLYDLTEGSEARLNSEVKVSCRQSGSLLPV